MKRQSLLIAIIIVLASCLAPAFAQSSQRLKGQIQYTRVSPPSAGVKLLNEILERVRSVPAFAMAKQGQLFQNKDSNYLSGVTNYQLAIKPKESPNIVSLPQLTAQLARSARQMAPAVDGQTVQTVGESKTRYFSARQQIAIVDDRPIVKDERAKIALLPPNVATGIPMVRLGITQQEAGQSLKSWGSMREDVIGNWTVWSFQRPNSQEPLLQIYMQHGLVEALRIFDRDLIGQELGVRLNDSVKVLKAQFGEPAFIMPEPQPGAGQNYVYPLSQVAFLLSRPNPKEDPQVVSLLIFNVK